MGRKKLPNNVKELKGTDRADRQVENGMSAERVRDIPEAPDHLNKLAVEIWVEYAGKLIPIGVLKETDLEMFAAFCCEAADYREAVTILSEEGNYIEEKYSDGTVRAKRRHPAITVRNNAFKNMKSIGSEFGLSPHSSQGINMEDQDSDPLDSHLNKKTG